MSRDYNCFCPECMKEDAREDHLSDDDKVRKYQVQCLNPECGCNFIKTVTTEYKKLKVKGVSDKHWKKAYNEIFGSVRK